jgi:hypothetical protein
MTTTPRDDNGLSERSASDLLRQWAKAYRNGPRELRFPSDPDAEFFPCDMEKVATAIDALTARVKELEEDFAKLSEMAKTSEKLRKATITVAEEWQARALRAEQERDEAMKALRSVSTQCGNVIFNCTQRSADNERHLSSWRGVKESADSAIRRLSAGPEKEGK